MAAPIDFIDQVAIVTGAGSGIGRAHALTLASRGAAVVVNDIGTGIDGKGADEGPAESVAKQINSVGGRAVASTHDVASPEGGRAIVDRALEAFGRVDLPVHNAGIVHAGNFAETPLDDVRRVLDVHLMGAWHVGQPAWHEMETRGYGRIVLTASGAIFGHPMVGPYAAAKFGLIGLARSLHHEALAKQVDIKINTVCPIAATRMAREAQKQRWGDLLDPAEVSAVVAYLLSRECRVSGEVLHAGGTHLCRIFVGQTLGWAKGVPGLLPEEVAEHLDDAFDEAGYAIPLNTNSSTDLLFERVTGRREALATDEIVPREMTKTGSRVGP